jgi:hypothetical protein
MMNHNEEYFQEFLASENAAFIAAWELCDKLYMEKIKYLFTGALYMGREVAVDLEAVICCRRLRAGRRGSRS